MRSRSLLDRVRSLVSPTSQAAPPSQPAAPAPETAPDLLPTYLRGAAQELAGLARTTLTAAGHPPAVINSAIPLLVTAFAQDATAGAVLPLELQATSYLLATWPHVTAQEIVAALPSSPSPAPPPAGTPAAGSPTPAGAVPTQPALPSSPAPAPAAGSPTPAGAQPTQPATMSEQVLQAIRTTTGLRSALFNSMDTGGAPPAATGDTNALGVDASGMPSDPYIHAAYVAAGLDTPQKIHELETKVAAGTFKAFAPSHKGVSRWQP